MRSLILFSVFCFLLQNGNTQICHLDNIEFNSQSSIDSFPILYGSCEEFQGRIFIRDGVKNLDSLSFINKFNGEILLSTNDSLNIDGLRNLEEIFILNFSTSKVLDFTPMANLRRVTGSLHFSVFSTNVFEDFQNLKYVDLLNLSQLEFSTLAPFTSIDTINGIDLDQLNNLDSLDFNIFNTSLRSIRLSQMNNLKQIVLPEDPNHLKSLTFSNLPLLDFEFENLDKITSLEELFLFSISNELSFPNLEAVEFLRLQQNEFSNIGLGNLTHLSRLFLINNPNLSSCSLLPICNLIRFGPPYVSIISGNQGDCENKFTLLQSCFNDHIINTQFFYDFNEDLIKDENEPLIKNLSSNIMPEPIFTFDIPETPIRRSLAENGDYIITFDDSSIDWKLTDPTQQYSISLDDNYLEDTFLFAVKPLSDVSLVESYLFNEIERCNTFSDFEIQVENTGFQIEDGIIWLELETKIDSFRFAFFDTPDTIINEYLVGWFFKDLGPTQSIKKLITYRVPGPPDITVGDSLRNNVYLEYGSNNGITKFDTATYQFEIRCSYDPNDKLVEPNRLDKFTLLDDTLHYTIRFQNTGNDVAYDVVIRDTLDENLDISTFKFLNSSHNDYLKVIKENDQFLTFEFKNIFLPDMIRNQTF